MSQILEPRLPIELEDAEVNGEAGAREWTAKFMEELARQLGVMNDYYYPLIGAVVMLRAAKSE